MSGKLMLKKVIAIVKLSLIFAGCWPLSKRASKSTVFCVTLYWYTSTILAICMVTSLIYAAKNHLDDPVILIKVIFAISTTAHIIWNFIFQKINYHRIEYITFELINFSELMRPNEEVIVQRYIKKCIAFYGTFLPFFYITALAVIMGPLMMDEPFPTLAEYPFNVFYQPVRSIIYVHQSLIGLQISSQICTNIFMALLLWYASARLEMLNEMLRTATNIYHVMECVKKHQQLLEYAAEVADVACPFLLSTVVSSMITIIIAFLIFFSKQPLSLVVQFSCVAISGLVEMFMYAWPAENLINMCNSVAIAAFDVQWYKNSAKIRKCLQIIILRSQKPITIAIPCIIPALSLRYYTSYLSSILSYFTALRVLFNNEEN